MTINLRKRKQGKSNKVALYLDIYKGRIIANTGKIKYQRVYEHLNMFIYDVPKTESDKAHNKEILQLAKNIKNQRELDIYSGRYNLKSDTEHKYTNFCEYYRNIIARYDEGSYRTGLETSFKTLVEFAGENITFAKVDDAFCKKIFTTPSIKN